MHGCSIAWMLSSGPGSMLWLPNPLALCSSMPALPCPAAASAACAAVIKCPYRHLAARARGPASCVLCMMPIGRPVALDPRLHRCTVPRRAPSLKPQAPSTSCKSPVTGAGTYSCLHPTHRPTCVHAARTLQHKFQVAATSLHTTGPRTCKVAQSTARVLLTPLRITPSPACMRATPSSGMRSRAPCAAGCPP
jgi:hypothetical protein